MSPLLTIGITSYNRINELERCIKSIKTSYPDEIEILISEDKSPQSKEIEKRVKRLSQESKYNIRFSSNDTNLGYDMNLAAIIKKSKGKYIFFLSDDDAIYGQCLDNIIEVLRKKYIYGVFYAPFVYSDTQKKDRLRLNTKIIKAGERNASKYIYDSILFSGLIFRKKYVEKFNAERFKNHNYFQVYLFLQMIMHYGGYYFQEPSVLCVGDGENAYGISESSGGNEILANRKSIISNLEFNKTLIKVIKMFDKDEKCNVFDKFSKQYSIHSYSGLSIARGEGLEYFKRYWKTLNQLDIKIYPIAKCYYILLLLLGQNTSNMLLSGFRKILKKE